MWLLIFNSSRESHSEPELETFAKDFTLDSLLFFVPLVFYDLKVLDFYRTTFWNSLLLIISLKISNDWSPLDPPLDEGISKASYILSNPGFSSSLEISS